MRTPRSQRLRTRRLGIRTTSLARDASGLTEMQRDALDELRRLRAAGRTATATACRVRRSVMQALVRKGHAVEIAPGDRVVVETEYDVAPAAVDQQTAEPGRPATMIVGYDLACYSYGSGPCVPPTKGYVRATRFDEAERISIMREILREEIARNPAHPRTTSILATFHWGAGERLQLRAGLLDRNSPKRVPYTWEPDAMASFHANTWVGADEPREGVTGSR